MESASCTHCGASIVRGALFCPKCQLAQPQTAQFSTHRDFIDPPHSPPMSTGAAAFLTFLLPGSGHYFLGHRVKGLLIIAGSLLLIIPSMLLLYIPWLFYVVWVMNDVYSIAQAKQRRYQEQLKYSADEQLWPISSDAL